MDQWQKRMEKVTANAVFRALQKQKREIQKYLKETGLSDFGLKIVLDRTNKPVIEAFLQRAKTTINRGFDESRKKWPYKLANELFSLPTKPASIYLESLKNLHLSQNKGSISATTEERVKNLVSDGIKKWLSQKEIAEKIQDLDKSVFSKNRADLIAINQIGKAKQFGEYLGVKEFADAGYLVLKYWSTVNDSRVTRTHTANQGDGWIEEDKTFSGTGDLIPPASDNPRCRCACLYKIGELKGRKQPKEIEQALESRNDKKGINEYIQALQSNYDYSKDILMQNANQNFFQWGFPQIIFELAPKWMWLTEEEAIAIDWYKSDQYYHINMALRNNNHNTIYNWIIIHLQSALYKMDMRSWEVWRWIHYQPLVTKIANMKKWDIITEPAFMSASIHRKVAESYWLWWILMNIQSKTGKKLGEIDASNDGEILFTPWTSLVFQKEKDGIYYFNEL